MKLLLNYLVLGLTVSMMISTAFAGGDDPNNTSGNKTKTIKMTFPNLFPDLSGGIVKQREGTLNLQGGISKDQRNSPLYSLEASASKRFFLEPFVLFDHSQVEVSTLPLDLGFRASADLNRSTHQLDRYSLDGKLTSALYIRGGMDLQSMNNSSALGELAVGQVGYHAEKDAVLNREFRGLKVDVIRGALKTAITVNHESLADRNKESQIEINGYLDPSSFLILSDGTAVYLPRGGAELAYRIKDIARIKSYIDAQIPLSESGRNHGTGELKYGIQVSAIDDHVALGYEHKDRWIAGGPSIKTDGVNIQLKIH